HAVNVQCGNAAGPNQGEVRPSVQRGRTGPDKGHAAEKALEDIAGSHKAPAVGVGAIVSYYGKPVRAIRLDPRLDTEIVGERGQNDAVIQELVSPVEVDRQGTGSVQSGVRGNIVRVSRTSGLAAVRQEVFAAGNVDGVGHCLTG